MTRPRNIKALLKSANSQINDYVIQLEQENSEFRKNTAKLHKKIAALEAKNVDQKQRIAALEREIKKPKKVIHEKIEIEFVKPAGKNT